MQRTMDLVRDILLAVEAEKMTSLKDLLGLESPFLSGLPSDDDRAVAIGGHLDLLINQAEFLEGMSVPMRGFNLWQDLQVTWKGHDFLDTVRDDGIWQQTKEGASGVGGFTVDLLASLAKGFVKKKLEQHTGFEL